MAIAVRDNPALANGMEGYLDDSIATQIDSIWLYDLDDRGQASSGREIVSFTETLDEGYSRMRSFSTLEAEERPTIYVNGVNTEGAIFDLHFSPDGNRIVFTKAPYQTPQDIRLYSVDSNGETDVRYRIQRVYLTSHVSDVVETMHEVVRGELGKTPLFKSRKVLPLPNDRVFGLDNRELIEFGSGRVIATAMHTSKVLRAGYIESSDIFWGASEDGAINFWDASTGGRILTLYSFPGNRFFAVTPEGRYDTNLGPDTNLIRWVVPDAPWQSLASQTFMRDYYEPGLYRKLLDCRVAGNCESAFAPLRSIASLNRVLPSVEIMEVGPGKDASEALVEVKVTEGVDPDAANGKTRSGISAPRLFIDNRLVATAPETSRKTHRGSRSSQPQEQLFTFRVPVATHEGSSAMRFSAYAFNEDRIKSETASFAYERPPATPRQRRAFVINIGIDHYESAKFASLSFAGNDATLLAGRLNRIPGYETRQITIGGARDRGSSPPAVNRQLVLDALGLLVSDKGRRQALRTLAGQGIDASALEVATPDDIVIISYAGHGWADQHGDFFLIPSDVRWDFDSDALQRDTAISAQDLTSILELVQAGEISLIIDACHSAASVDSGEFKPGPMGDASLGQLAYDKGIRILAAAQADDLALEDARLQQGLLTYALAREGLTDEGGASDQNRDGTIRLDEWLAYAVQRLPELSEDIGRGNFRSITFLNTSQAQRTVRVQRPSLFDFNTQPSQIILRSNLNNQTTNP